jgi:hypothetical protein
MRRPQRLIAAAVLIAFSGALAGCSSGFGSSFDPSDLLDFLDTKKKLPGDRKPVFPDGVPGLEQGVPKELYKGAQQTDQQQNADAAPGAMAPAAPPPPEEPKSKQMSRSKGKGKQAAVTAAAPAAAPAEEPNGEAMPEEETMQAAPPAPKPAKKQVRRRTTAPPPDQSSAAQPAQSAQAPFPAPMPSGSFSR